MLNEKHAYLIMAHNQFYILDKLIRLLDDERNDIYIHIDKKIKEFDFDKFKSIPLKSNLFFIPRISVNWGGYSVVNCEMLLLKESIKKNYQYYHLLSGVDLPLKSQDYIHEFFNQNNFEFIHFDEDDNSSYSHRIKYYHFLQENLRKPNNYGIRLAFKIVNKILLIFQMLIGVNRLRKLNMQVYKGANWFSITNKLAHYILENEDWIKKTFSKTSCADEMFLQIIVCNSEFRGKLYNKEFDNNYLSCMRLIDWKRGKPYIWKMQDFDELINTEYLFARKFDCNIDIKIIDKLYKALV